MLTNAPSSPPPGTHPTDGARLPVPAKGDLSGRPYNPAVTDDAAAESSPGRPRLNGTWLLASGIIYLVGGAVALLNPYLASLVAQSLIALSFLIGGSISTWMAFRNEDGTTGNRIVGGVLGVLAVAFAVALWANPLAGLLSLTLTVAIFLLAIGMARVWLGLRMRLQPGWGWIVGSGVLTILLSLYIFATLPVAALSVLGIFLAVELTFAGAAQIATALHVRTHSTFAATEPVARPRSTES